MVKSSIHDKPPEFIRVEYFDVETGALLFAVSVETGVDLDHAIFSGPMNPWNYKMVLTPYWRTSEPPLSCVALPLF